MQRCSTDRVTAGKDGSPNRSSDGKDLELTIPATQTRACDPALTFHGRTGAFNAITDIGVKVGCYQNDNRHPHLWHRDYSREDADQPMPAQPELQRRNDGRPLD